MMTFVTAVPTSGATSQSLCQISKLWGLILHHIFMMIKGQVDRKTSKNSFIFRIHDILYIA